MFPSHLLFIPTEIIRIIEELEGIACLVHADMKPTLVALCCSVAQSCLTLCDPMDYSLPVSSIHGILQAAVLEWLALPSSRGSSRPRDQTHVSYVSCISRWVLYH